MMNIDKSLSRVKLNVSIMTLLVAALFGCAKKDTSFTSNYELQKQRSLEIENSSNTGVFNNGEQVLETSAQEATPVISGDAVAPLVAKENKMNVANTRKMEKAQVKIEKLKKMIEKKTIKIQNKIEKNKASGLNSNLKLGLILILIGILIAVLLGSLVNGYVFGAIGTIIAVIGIVFLILGLLEM